MHAAIDGCDVVVVGAGIAGLAAARSLVTAGHDVVIVDKARGVGGRMATRRIGKAVLDHGAQFFSVRSRAFGGLVAAAESSGDVRVWSDRFCKVAADGHLVERPETGDDENGRPLWCGVSGMTVLPKLLAEGQDIRCNRRVAAVSIAGGGVQLSFDSGDRLQAAALILTPPVPQALELLSAGGVTVDDDLQRQLVDIRYDPCFAVMAVLSTPSLVPAPGGLSFERGIVAWLADNQQKGISPLPAITIHASADFSREHFDDEPAAVATQLLEGVAAWLRGGITDVVEKSLHRWKFARPCSIFHSPLAVVRDDPPVLLAGDAFAGPRVESAASSGLAAGRWLQRRLGAAVG